MVEGSKRCWTVQNPAHPKENFADKWNEDDRKAVTFQQWIGEVRELVHCIRLGQEPQKMTDIEKAWTNRGQQLFRGGRGTSRLPTGGALGGIAAAEPSVGSTNSWSPGRPATKLSGGR